VITIMHDLNLAALFARRIVALHNGRIARDGVPAATITDDMLAEVFGVAGAVNRAPPAGLPFVLPHAATKL
jgi:iron complex transport system ATP-binding protein